MTACRAFLQIYRTLSMNSNSEREARPPNSTALEELQERLGVRFKDLSRLQRAVTHRSATIDDSLRSNERLEFLGDSVIGLIISENLFRLHPDHTEGELAKAKAYIVSEPVLAEAAVAMGLDAFLVLSAGEDASGGRRRRSILADAFEAVLAAVYLDCGLRSARRIVRAALRGAIEAVFADEHRRDYKSSLQERTQGENRMTPVYRIVAERGRDHDKIFTAEALLEDTVLGQGSGKSKKEAEQAAARNALGAMPAAEPTQ